jgi:hypothetical protein
MERGCPAEAIGQYVRKQCLITVATFLPAQVKFPPRLPDTKGILGPQVVD